MPCGCAVPGRWAKRERHSETLVIQFAAMKTQFDVPYSSEFQDQRRMDLFLPGECNGGAVLFIHGGGWSGGSLRQWHDVADHFCRLGYLCASAEYRLAPATTLPGQVEDVRLAMAYLRGRADELGAAPDRIAAAGSSAGGHLVALLATIAADDPLGLTDELAGRDSRPNAAVCYCPVVTLHESDRLTESVRKLMGCREADAPELFRAGSPIDRISGDEPPFLFLQGDADDTTPPEQTAAMHEKLVAHGVVSELVMLPGVEHGFGYGVTSDAQIDAVGRVARFLEDQFGAGAA